MCSSVSRPVCLRCAENRRGDRQRDGEAGQRHHRTRSRLQESAFRPGAAEDALRQDPPLLFSQPGQREALQGTTRLPLKVKVQQDKNCWGEILFVHTFFSFFVPCAELYSRSGDSKAHYAIQDLSNGGALVGPALIK